MSKKIAIFPGSFDPFTIGHESVITRALPLFDEIIVAIGSNTNKKTYFSIEQRMQMIREVFSDTDRVKIESYEGLTVEYCRQKGARYLLRGLRTSSDFEYERAIAQTNKAMYPELESVFLLTLPEHTPIKSTIVREIIRLGGDASQFIPKVIDLSKFPRHE
ncbi:MAG: pantetheine-phosphate adenylyltransferase [Bacteroidales bacterium]|nr:pantetheine-phosphate adenylyltransferase [Bacteroidales bacterium]